MNKFLTILTVFSLMLMTSLSAQTEMLTGGDMESLTPWTVSYLNTPAENPPTVSWGYTSDAPTHGVGGNLYATGMTTAGNVQYCIYQELTLTAGKQYTFDGAFKALQINNSWCEVFIGPKPTDGDDYTTDTGTRIAAFGTWAPYSNADGKFSTDIDAGNYKKFIPATTGTYYFVLKMGSTSWDNSEQTFEIIVDELSLLESREKPVVDFTANYTVLFPNSPIQFTDKSLAADQWSWNFGDGSAVSTEQNPIHSYTSAGIYNVTLTATNEVGETVLEKQNFIIVNAAETLTGGGVLLNGDMSAQGSWNVSYLNTDPTNETVVSTWNDQVHTLGAGQGGSLFVTGNAPGGQNAQYCIYQEVTLSSDKLYEFNAAFKDFSANLNNAWIEVYVGPMPVDGQDYLKDNSDNFLLAEITTWNGDCSPKGTDATFELRACEGTHSFAPPTSGSYYFVVKIGSWEGGDFSMAIDELSLTEMASKPLTAFSADVRTGMPSLTVSFTDNSTFAESWDWDFGDGSEHSTMQNPTHSYTQAGVYTVTLTATNGTGSTELVKENYVAVKGTLTAPEMIYGGNMEVEAFWNVSVLNGNSFPKSIAWNYTENMPENGVGGNLHLAGSGEFNQYAIWQEVQLTEGKQYLFEGNVKRLIDGDIWCEVSLGTSAPVAGSDYSDNMFCSYNPDNGEVVSGAYAPPVSGTYYLVVKMGSWYSDYDFVIDELSLKEAPIVEADFFALGDVEGPAPLDVSLMASGNAVTYEWDFGDGTTGTGTAPAHTYTVPGVYTVTLVAKNGIASKTVTYTDMITVTGTSPVVSADFSADVLGGDVPLKVQFTDESTGANSWAWDFGDGQTSTEKNPLHTYTSAGTYTVTLVASNTDNSDTEEKVDYISTISTGIENANFSQNVLVYPNPTTGLVNLSLEGITDSRIEVYTISGKKVLTKLQTNEEIITLKLESEGLYFVRITNENFSATKKVIVKK